MHSVVRHTRLTKLLARLGGVALGLLLVGAVLESEPVPAHHSDWNYYFKKTTANTGTNCASATRLRDMEEGYLGSDPEETFSRTTGGATQLRFCAAAFTSAYTMAGGTTTVEAYVNNSAGSSCGIRATVYKNSGGVTTGLGNTYITIPGQSATTMYTWNITTSSASFASGDRLNLSFNLDEVKACDSTDIHYGGTTNRSNVQFPDQPPNAVNDTATVAEDAAATSIPVLTNDTNPDGGPKTISSATQPANGTVVLTGGTAGAYTGLTYRPNANYCNGGSPTDNFTYTLNGGDTATVSMTVTCVDDMPVAVNDSRTVTEDAAATAVTVLSNDTDVDGGTKTISSATQPANGTVVLTGGTTGAWTGLTYRPNANYCNGGSPTDNFTYTLNGGSTATVSMTVTCVDDVPVAVNDSATVAEDASATAVSVLTNDTDIDGGPKTISSLTQPANGTVVGTGGTSGAWTGLTYRPNANYCNGGSPTDNFTYTLNGGSTATVSMTVSCVDDMPTAVNDSATVAEDASATAVSVLTNDTDIDGGPKTISSLTQPANGTVVGTGGTSGAWTGLTYRPNANYCNGGSPTDNFTYTLNGGSTATVSMTVSCVDDAPVAVNDSATVAEDSGATTINVRSNDTDIDGGPKTIQSAGDPANGTVVVAADNLSLTYEPDPNYCTDGAPPDDTFTYTLNGGSQATVSVAVTCVDDGPTAVNDSATVVEDSSATTINVLANDTDIDGGPKQIASASDPGNGTVVVAGDNLSVTYEPDPNYCNEAPADDTFTYTVNGGSQATVSVAVSCVDDLPTAVDDSATVEEDSGANAIDVLANDSDIDGGPATISSASDPTNGTVVLTGGSSGAYTGLTYEPDANYCDDGPAPDDTFTYTRNGGSQATVSIAVHCVNDAPVAVNDSASFTEDDGPSTIDVLANDTDIDGGAKQIASASDPANGTVEVGGDNLSLTYQPDPDYCNDGAPPDDTFTYTLNGGSQATVSVAVSCVEDDPVAVDDSATVAEDSGATTLDVLANDTDVDGGAKQIISATQPDNGTVVVAGDDLSLTYEPDPNYCKSEFAPPDTFTYTLNGGSQATVSVAVSCVDDAPVAVNDSASASEDDPATTIDVRANDTDIDGGPKTIQAASDPANGSVVVAGDNLSLTYEPDPNYCNEGAPPDDTFTYTLNGGSQAMVSVAVSCVDDAPVAVNDSASVTEEDAATAVDVLANDTDVDGGARQIASASDPANGTVAIAGDNLSLTYEPDPNYCNEGAPPDDTFTYTVNGGSQATVSVAVSCVDDMPTAVNDSSTVSEDSGANAIDVLANDTDVDGGPKTISSASQPSNGTVVLTGGSAGAYTGLTYEPDPNYCNDGAPPDDTFTYTINGGTQATVSVAVSCVDDAPVAVNDSASVTEDDPATTIDVRANDTDADGGPKTIQSASDPANGTVAIAGDNLSLTYEPDPNYCNDGAPPDDTFTYTLNGGSQATVSVAVICVEDDPTAVDDAATVDEDSGATTLNLLANDTDPDGGTKQITSASDPANGTVVVAGDNLSLTYEPDPNYCNDGAPPDDTFTYTLNGGSQATVSVAVSCVDDAPVAVDDSSAVGEDSGANAIDVLANDTDIDTGPKTISSASDPANGTVVLTGGSAGAHTGLTYEPDPNYCNGGAPPDDTFTYTINGGSQATVSVEVSCVNDAPVAANDSASFTEEDGPATVDVLANDTDVDGGTKEIASASDPANGSVAIAGDNLSLTYQPDPNYCNGGPAPDDTFTYTLNGGSQATVSVAVSCVDDMPVSVDDSVTVDEDSGANALDVLGNDTDIDGGPKSIQSASDPANGTVVITGGGSGLTYEPDRNYCNDGTPPLDTFTYTLNGGSQATVSVAVTCGVDDPQAVNDSASVAEDSGATTVDVLANDTDPDGGPKQIASASDPDNGTVVVAGDSLSLTYQPDQDYCNEGPAPDDTFTYTVNGGSQATVSVAVSCVDDDPTAVDDTPSVAEDANATAIDVLPNDTDGDGGPKSIQSASDPANGTVVITGGGSGLTYRPDPDYCNDSFATDDFTYTLNGGSQATVFVSVNCVDDDPVAVNDSATVAEDSAATTIDVRANDTDVDAGAKTISSASDPANGTVAVAADNLSLSYRPDSDYCNEGPPPDDTFTYTLNGGSQATVSVEVTCIDDDPVAVDDSRTVDEDAGATALSILANDTDVDGGSLTISSASDPANGTVVLTGGAAGEHTGLTYEPDPDYCDDGGPTDDFNYTINGGSQATVSVAVSCVDDNPIALDDSASFQEDDPAAAIDVLGNDTDVDGGPKVIESASDPANGTVALTGGTAGAHTGLTYEPDPNYCDDGAPPDDTFTYTLNGGGQATVSIAVSCVEDDPTAVDDGATVQESSNATTFDVLANDPDPDGGQKLIQTASDPANGEVQVAADGLSLSYTPDAGYCNDGGPTDDFSYTLNGGSEALVQVAVTCVDDAPSAVDDSASLAEDAPATPITVLGNDTDTDGGPKTIDSASDPANGTVNITGGGSGLTYTPDADYCNDGGPTDDFTYQLNGGSEATVQVTVTCVPDDPRAVDDTPTLAENDPATAVDPLANDNDPDGGAMEIMSASDPANGTVVVTGGGTDLTYEPDPRYCNEGGQPDTFTYRLNGGSTGTVRPRVTCFDDMPTAVDDAGVANEDSFVLVDVLRNDPDIDGGPKTVVTASDPAHGRVSVANGGTAVYYVPDPNYCNDGAATDNFSYEINGGSEALVEMRVVCLDEPQPSQPSPPAVVKPSQQLDIHKVIVPGTISKLLRKGVRVQATCRIDCRILLTVGVTRSVANGMGLRNPELARGSGLAEAGKAYWVTAKVTGGARRALLRYTGGGRLQVNVQALDSGEPYAQMSFSSAPSTSEPLLLPED